jgi:hypothetical protein
MRLTLTALAVMTLTACYDSSPTTIVIDHWWNADYAKGACETSKKWLAENRSLINQIGCDTVTSCSEMMPQATACTVTTDPEIDVRLFENELTSHFSINPACRGVQVIRYEGPKKTSAKTEAALANVYRGSRYWSLAIDFVPGKDKQSWGITRGEDLVAITPGPEGNAMEIARDVCTIVSGRGAKILN